MAEIARQVDVASIVHNVEAERQAAMKERAMLVEQVENSQMRIEELNMFLDRSETFIGAYVPQKAVSASEPRYHDYGSEVPRG